MSQISQLEVRLDADTAQFQEGLARARAELGLIGQASREAAQQTQSAFDSLSRAEQIALNRLKSAIDPTTRALTQLERQQRQLQAQFAAGNLTQAEYARYMQVLDRNLQGVISRERLLKTASTGCTEALQRQQKMVQRLNISHGQYQMALRLLPMQMTDVVTQLASGQNPLLILIQQGGQVRDSFGGIRNIFIALSQVISPLSLLLVGLAGAGGAWAYALYQADQEQRQFQRGLILTGHYAGLTTSQLQRLAQSLAGDGVTRHGMADSLAQVVSSGAFSDVQVARVARAAAQMEQAVGQSVEETISQFTRLQQEPLSAVQALDEALHFLSAATLQQIATLEEQGRRSDAARLAIDAYASALNERAHAIRDDLGYLEAAWHAVSDTAAAAWESMLNLGREQTLEARIAALAQQIQAGGRQFGAVFVPANQQDHAQLARLREEKYQRDVAAARDKAERQEQERQKRQLAANRHWQALYESEEQQHQRRLEAIRNSAASEAVKQAALAEERRRYQSRQDRRHAPREDEGQRLLAQYRQRQAQLDAELATARQANGSQLLDAERQRLQLQQRLSDMQGRQLSDNDKSLLANRQQLELLLAQNMARETALARQQALNALQRKGDQLAQQASQEMERARYQQESLLAGTQLGNQARQRLQQALALRQYYQTRLDQLERDSRAKGTQESDAYRQVTAALRDNLAQRLALLERYHAQVDAQESNWQLGAIRALNNVAEQGEQVATLTEGVFTRAFDGMGDALAHFALTGKLEFRSFAASVLSDLAKMELRIAASKTLGLLLNFGRSLLGGSNEGYGANAFDNGMYNHLRFNALGGVYRTPSLHRYSGSVVSHPTVFAFAQGAGIMGEAGAEAILPLRRAADGKLGVVASGVVRESNFSPVYNITINNDGQRGEIGPQALAAIYEVSRRSVADYLATQRRDGGLLGEP
ncbi:phage tail tape measure protein [Edwardsiella tarda]